MPDDNTSTLSTGQEHPPAPADISITAQGDRRALEALYLELRELAKQRGLTVEYRLSQTRPADQADT
jgi:hypothetical protein